MFENVSVFIGERGIGQYGDTVDFLTLGLG